VKRRGEPTTKRASRDVDEHGLPSRGRRDFLYQTAIVIGTFFSGVLGAKRARADDLGIVTACCILAKPHTDTCHSQNHASPCRGWVLYWDCTHEGTEYWCVECYEIGGRNPGDDCWDKDNVHCSRAVTPDKQGDLVPKPRRKVPEPEEPPEVRPEDPDCGDDEGISIGISIGVGDGGGDADGVGDPGTPGWPEPGTDCDPRDPADSPPVGE